MYCHQNPIYVFPEKELRSLSPNFHIHVSVSDLYIPRDVEIGTEAAQFLFWNICFEFSLLCLRSADSLHKE
jgi:hypothetical protein